MTDDANTKRRLGEFEVLRELGRGGMGIVYEAKQLSLNRNVALKVISSGLGLSSKAVLRFQREAEAAGKLHHTNIVPIYSIGQDDGTHFYAMELVDGPSLHQVIQSLRTERPDSAKASDTAATVAVEAKPIVSMSELLADSSSGGMEAPAWVSELLGSLPVPGESTPAPSSRTSSTSLKSSSNYFDTVAKMMAGVADALDHAHDHGVIHRDMKPANLLLSADGRLSINDFGLARMLEQPGMTMSGEFVGSPLYMSPEQITAGRAPLDHRTDIYSLGATLYELLTLEPPFPGKSRDEVISQVIHKEPVPPRRQNPKVPVDLETICLKAMDKDPDRRYQTAGQLAEDLRRFVNRFAISARRVGLVGQTVRWCRRHRALSAATCCAIVLGLLLVVFAIQAHLSRLALEEERRERAVSDAFVIATTVDEDATRRAIEKAELLGAETWVANMLRGQLALFAGKPAEAVPYLKHASELKPQNIAVRSLLASSYLSLGRWEDYDPLEAELTRAKPDNDRDRLFLGQLLSLLDPRRGVEMLESATSEAGKGISNLAWVLLAHARANLALDTYDLRDAERAVADATTAQHLLPDSPIAVEAQVFAQQVAAAILGKLHRLEESQQMDREARRTFEKLAEFPEFFPHEVYDPALNWALRSEDSKERLEMLERLVSKAQASQSKGARLLLLVTNYVVELYANGRLDEARRALESLGESGSMEWAGMLLPVMVSEVSGVDAGLDAYHLLPSSRSFFVGGYYVLALHVLGMPELATSEFARLRAEGLYIPAHRDGWYQTAYDFFLARITAEELLAKAAGPPTSHMSLSEGHFYVGVQLLSRGRKKEATLHFEKSVAAGVWYFIEHQLSRAFLARRAKDPTWPPWIESTE